MTKDELIFLSVKHSELCHRMKIIALYQMKISEEISAICDVEKEILQLILKTNDDFLSKADIETRA